MCTNGILSLGSAITTFTPSAFPLSESGGMVASYWADADPNVGGNVWARVSTNASILRRASNMGRLLIKISHTYFVQNV